MDGFDDIFNNFNFVAENKKQLDGSVKAMPCLGLSAIPYFG
jgi:hypothetical protein